MDELAAGRSFRDRREFLRSVGTLLGGAALAGCGDLVGIDGSSGRRKRLVIVGAGLSGLVAGYELGLLGHQVTVLEAQDRVGGRVRTVRAPFLAGQFAEAGAARIPPDHDLTLGYAEELNLPVDSFYPPDDRYARYVDGGRTPVAADEYLRGSRATWLKLVDGSDSLPLAFAAALGPRVRLSTPVVRIDQSGTDVVVTADDGSTVAGDRALCTVPLPVQSRIRFVPELSPLRREAQDGGVPYQESTRIFVQFSQRVWAAQGFNGWVDTGDPAREELWHPTWDRAASPGILLSYLRQASAVQADARGGEGRVQIATERWNGIFPGVADRAAAAASHSWQEDPWSGKAYATGSQPRYDTILREPEGRIHFAGEHAGDTRLRGWMQGALASGLRAVQEIHRA